MGKGKGIKRHESLYPLSHHHHSALFLALKLKRAGTEEARDSVEKVWHDLKEFWEPDGQNHFREEEEILLPAYYEYGPIETPEIQEMLIEHVKIRSAFYSLIQDSPDSTPEELLPRMHELGQMLEEHVRKEERIIFPVIEKAIPEEKLQELSVYFT
ncbi:hemerythrin domain-containing protein [Alteribacillus iranensis]|uniref:Hemerythrin HHE cation binding domain-containing protein n=1 Tax=Alteribacillus iranensis TaxID=930128 RepID=A0A1I1ZXT9_9BACI|nr:hemerythrin domain-containing protein [Alteribacillus iranensis]SFE36465.1 Hemerythrin HHE cation binding domain-containing protein [Alteribacillus iranensis]